MYRYTNMRIYVYVYIKKCTHIYIVSAHRLFCFLHFPLGRQILCCLRSCDAFFSVWEDVLLGG